MPALPANGAATVVRQTMARAERPLLLHGLVGLGLGYLLLSPFAMVFFHLSHRGLDPKMVLPRSPDEAPGKEIAQGATMGGAVHGQSSAGSGGMMTCPMMQNDGQGESAGGAKVCLMMPGDQGKKLKGDCRSMARQ